MPVGKPIRLSVAAMCSSDQRPAMLRTTAKASSAVEEPCSPERGLRIRSSECCPPCQWIVSTTSRTASSTSAMMSTTRLAAAAGARASSHQGISRLRTGYPPDRQRCRDRPRGRMTDGHSGDFPARAHGAKRTPSSSPTAQRSGDYRGHRRRSDAQLAWHRTGLAGVPDQRSGAYRLGVPVACAVPRTRPRSPWVLPLVTVLVQLPRRFLKLRISYSEADLLDYPCHSGRPGS
ncbi:hypothetical protein ABIB85_008354 [Bradyrhizobium sp. JR1.5]